VLTAAIRDDGGMTVDPGVRVVMQCVVDGCPWELDMAIRRGPNGLPYVPPGDYRSIDELVTASVRAHVEWEEREVGAHLRSHDLLDFVRTIASLRNELAKATSA
jgi:hypothetical protein